VLAVSAFVKEDHQNVVIGLFSSIDSIEVVRIHSEPEALKINFVGEDRRRISIAEFDQDGPALPQIVSIFKDHFRSRQILFLIVKWHYYLSGLDTEADFYEVHAIDVKFGNSHTHSFARDEFLTMIFGSGMDGKHEGKHVRFKFKDVASIRRRLRELN
jgi:hypothetical protein